MGWGVYELYLNETDIFKNEGAEDIQQGGCLASPGLRFDPL